MTHLKIDQKHFLMKKLSNLKGKYLRFCSTYYDLVTSGGEVVQLIPKISSPADANGCQRKSQEVIVL